MLYELIITLRDDTNEKYDITNSDINRIVKCFNDTNMRFIHIYGQENKYIWPDGIKQIVVDYTFDHYINKDSIKQIILKKIPEENDEKAS